MVETQTDYSDGFPRPVAVENEPDPEPTRTQVPLTRIFLGFCTVCSGRAPNLGSICLPCERNQAASASLGQAVAEDDPDYTPALYSELDECA